MIENEFLCKLKFILFLSKKREITFALSVVEC